MPVNGKRQLSLRVGGREGGREPLGEAVRLLEKQRKLKLLRKGPVVWFFGSSGFAFRPTEVFGSCAPGRDPSSGSVILINAELGKSNELAVIRDVGAFDARRLGNKGQGTRY